MAKIDPLLRRLGWEIRTRRGQASLTQRELGRRAGLSAKYISEIERATRDLPLSTAQSLVAALGCDLELTFAHTSRGEPTGAEPLPRSIEDLARALAAIPADQRGPVLAIVRAVIRLADG